MNSREGSSGVKRSHSITNQELAVLHENLSIKLRKADDDCKEFTIFRAPLNIRESKRSMFEPSLVSIGPYHRGRPHLRAMEEKKWSFFRDFLRDGRCTLEDCIGKIADLVNPARRCYSEPFDMSNEDFAEMMVLDGCFIIEFFYKNLKKIDLIAISEGWISLIKEKDLILLENQIPFFIIESLQRLLGDALNLQDIAELLTRQLITKQKSLPRDQSIYHLLHLCHCYAVPVPEQVSHSPQNVPHVQNFPDCLNWMRYFSLEKDVEVDEKVSGMAIPCAIDLEEAGVKFKKAKKSDHLTKIIFKSGTLEIPPLHIDNGLKPLLMNLVCLEQCMSLILRSHFSTYFLFMDKLVNTPHDVKLLQQKGILDNMLSSEEEVTHFFNQTGQSVHIPSDHYLANLFQRVNQYSETRYHRYRARLCRDYFNNPWSIISLIAAFVLLLLTFLQAFMAVFSYIYPSN